MKSNWIAVSAFLQAHVSVTDAQVFGLTDPRLCYLLDGILFFYAIIITALLFREKLTRKSTVPDQAMYSTLNQRAQVGYDELRKGGDPKTGGKRGNPKTQDNSLYNELQVEKMNEPYSDIRLQKQQPRRKGKGNEKVYQELSAARRDTYDALQMQPLP